MKNNDLTNEVNEMLNRLMHPDLEADHEPDEVEIDHALLDLQAAMKRNRVKYVIMTHWGRDEDNGPQGRFGLSGTDKDIREALAYAVLRVGTDKSRSVVEREKTVAVLSETLMTVTNRLIKEVEGTTGLTGNHNGRQKS